MVKRVFEFHSYRTYLSQYIAGKPGRGRGFKAQMAEAMNCQRSFVSKVLTKGSSVDLSLEQAIKLNALLGHTDEEAEYFLLLVQYSRAGNEELRDYVRKKMKEILNRRLQVSRELQSRNVLSAEDHIRYYGAWYHSAIRVAVGIPHLQTKEALAKRLKLPLENVARALEFLVSRGLIAQQGDRFFQKTDQQQIHLGSDHDLVTKHHANWRMRGLLAMDQEASRNLHYSFLVTLSEHDALKIRSFLVETLQEIQKRAAPSKEETLYSICLDYFEL
jgi:uncharacterized protein (TIGR02147 family)